MRLIRGLTLQEMLAAMPDSAAARVPLLAAFKPVCQTVGFAHSRGVAHRALGPEHVMIGAFGEAQVIGWGAARAVRRTAPEPGCGAEADCLADVFDLGSMLCALLTGRSNAAERLGGCGADPGLVALARRCLSPAPADRPPDACAVAASVAQLGH